MFRNTPAVNTEHVDTQVSAPAEPIPLSVLTLDLAEPPIEGWAPIWLAAVSSSLLTILAA